MRALLKRRWGLTVSLVIFIFLVMIATMILVGLLFIVMHQTGILDFYDIARPGNIIRIPVESQPGDISGIQPIPIDPGGMQPIPIDPGVMQPIPIDPGGMQPVTIDPGGIQPGTHTGDFPIQGVLLLLIFSVLLGTAIAGFFSKFALRPIRKIIDATHKVADGDFNVRLDIQSVYELEELSHSFNKMAHELSTTETLRGDFINNISHEFKTPIALIGGYAQLLKEEDLTEKEQQEYLDIIKMESERLTTLSTNVLNLSKYDNLEIVADIATFRLDEQLRKTVIQLEPKWSKQSINIDIEAEDIDFTGNPDLTQQVLLNLIDNAIKFSNTGGAITIRLEQWKEVIRQNVEQPPNDQSTAKNTDGVRLSIKDDGIGMDKAEQAHIFDRFYQGDTSRSKEGHGLGLPIVKRIVELCGGNINVQSRPGEGSEFIVWLPVYIKGLH